MKAIIKNIIIGASMAFIFSACMTPKTVAYFPKLTDGEILTLAQDKGIVLRPTDKLSIIVNTKSAQ